MDQLTRDKYLIDRVTGLQTWYLWAYSETEKGFEIIKTGDIETVTAELLRRENGQIP